MTIQTIVETVVSFVRDHEGWTAPVAFLVAFGESFCFLSLLWPGTAILAGVAALLAASGVEAHVLGPAIVAAGVGGSLGYAASYWIGLYFKDSVHKIWPFSTRPQLIGHGQEFFEKYGAFGVFLGHFFGPVRAVIPVVAGMFVMRQVPFQIANVASAFIWAGGVIAPAFYLVAFKAEVMAFLSAHEAVVALALFILAVANSVPRPLLFVPTLVLFAGIGALHLFAEGSFPLIWLVGAAGAFVGDLNAYRTGKIHQGNLKGAWPWAASAGSRRRARGIIEKWGVPAVLVSKFRGFNRGLVPLMAGATEMPPLPFIAASAASALMWSAILLVPAIVIGLVTRGV
jgi:membrane protein DedA with SNARE-associated domain